MMKTSWHLKLSALLIFSTILMFNACVDPEVANSNQTNVAREPNSEQTNPSSDDIGKLLDVVLLPEVPEEVVWKEEKMGVVNDRAPGPTDRKIIAVLQYTPENATKLIALIEKNKQPEPAEIDVENWFPEELIAQSQLSGAEKIKGMAYGANQFFNMPFGNGRITRIDGTDFFVLELFTA